MQGRNQSVKNQRKQKKICQNGIHLIHKFKENLSKWNTSNLNNIECKEEKKM